MLPSERPSASHDCRPIPGDAKKQHDSRITPIPLGGTGAALIENLGDVQDADRFLLAADQAVEVHQAGYVVGGEDFGAGAFVIVQAIKAHHR